MKKLNGMIRWFDGMSGEGMVRAEDGKCYFVHFTGIEGINKNNHHWPKPSDQKFLSNIEGVFCTFELFEGVQAYKLEF